MGHFNLNEYETVKERKVKFYEKHPEGRIIVENITPIDKLMEFALFRVETFINMAEQAAKLPLSTGYAMEVRETTMKKSRDGKEYADVNFSSWTENCEESAIGRALDNAGFSNKKCSKEEIEKAERMTATLNNAPQAPKPRLEAPFESNTDKVPLPTEIPVKSEIKRCPVCNGEHTGKYLKCIECWKKEQEYKTK